MTPWQLLHAGRAASAARAHHLHHGAAGPVQYSSGSAAGSAAADGCRSFCVSTEKVALQQLNERLASYLQQVGRASTPQSGVFLLQNCSHDVKTCNHKKKQHTSSAE